MIFKQPGRLGRPWGSCQDTKKFLEAKHKKLQAVAWFGRVMDRGLLDILDIHGCTVFQVCFGYAML